MKVDAKRQEIAALSQRNNSLNGADTSSCKARAKKYIMAIVLKCAWWKNGSLAQNLAEQLKRKTSTSRALAKRCAACNAELGAVKDERDSKSDQLKQKTSKTRDLAKCLAVCNAELGAAKEDIAAKDALIAAQRSKISEATGVILDKSNENLILSRELKKLRALHKVSKRSSASHSIGSKEEEGAEGSALGVTSCE